MAGYLAFGDIYVYYHQYVCFTRRERGHCFQAPGYTYGFHALFWGDRVRQNIQCVEIRRKMLHRKTENVCIEKADKRVIVALYLISFLIGVSFIVTKPLPYLSGGDTEYSIYARNIMNGNGFSHDVQPPYHPSVYRVPGYSIFLSLIYTLFGFNNLAVMLLQALLNAGVCVLIFYLARRYFSLKFSYLASALVAVYPFTAVFVHVIYSEILCIFLFTLGIFLFEKGRESGKALFFALSGLTLGYCLLVRPGTAFFPLFITGAYILVESLKKAWRHLLVFNLCVMLVWAPWIVRNYLVSGKVIPLTIESSEVFYWGSASIGKYSEDRISNRKFLKQMEEIQSKLDNNGLTGLKRNLEEKKLYSQYAIKNIKENPFIYLITCVKRIPRIWISSLVSGNITQSYGYMIFGGKQAMLDLMKYLTMACFLLAIYGIWVSRSILKRLIFLLLPIIYFSITHIFFHPEARYTLPARPYLLIFAAIGLAKIIKNGQIKRRMVSR